MIKVGVMVCSYYLLPDLSLPKTASDISLEDAIRLTRESGISAIELQDYRSGLFGFDFPKVPTGKVLREIKEVADSYRVKIPTISVMAGNLLAPDGNVQVNYIRRWLALAADIGIKVVKINVGAKSDELGNDAAFERARGRLLKLVRYAEEYDIPLAPELWPASYPTSDPVAMLTLLKNIDSPYFRFTSDNFVLPPDWAVTAYRLMAPYTANAHISPPRKGDLRGPTKHRYQFKDFIRILKENHYDGHIMIEWRSSNRPLEKLIEGLRKTKDMLEGIISSS
ncbi:MAG: sugar phosphate isomerase/epimerase [Thaumarchaeota archaeon]|nr:sugar phosphate isomerase/epimerase [Nitrososphaerota archaeon]